VPVGTQKHPTANPAQNLLISKNFILPLNTHWHLAFVSKRLSLSSLFFFSLVFHAKHSFLQLFANGWVYEKLGISERFTVKPHKAKYELRN